jgi:hypothetical protein
VANGIQRATLNRLYLLISLINLAVVIVSRGPIEGDQRSLTELSERSDWYGPIPPLLYGEWPPGGENWDLSLSVLQILFFCVGFFILINSNTQTYTAPLAFLKVSTFWIGMLFCSQLWRDATLLSFIILGFGIVKISLRFSNKLRNTFFALGLSFIILGLCCKFIYAPIVATLFILYFFYRPRLQSKSNIIGLVLFLALSIFPFCLDQSLSRNIDLKRNFPEQSPVIFDLASLYCWGSSLESNNAAIIPLRLTLKTKYPDQAICSSLEPTGWDTLRTDRPYWQYSSPLSPLTDPDKVDILVRAWINLIVNHPQEYLEVKIIHSTQVLTMANALGPRTIRNYYFLENKEKIKSTLEVLTLIPRLLDKFRVFSVSSILFLVAISLLRFTHSQNTSLLTALRRESALTFLLLSIVFQLFLTSISFVSVNGRYTLPFLVLALILYFNILDQKQLMVGREKAK